MKNILSSETAGEQNVFISPLFGRVKRLLHASILCETPLSVCAFVFMCAANKHISGMLVLKNDASGFSKHPYSLLASLPTPCPDMLPTVLLVLGKICFVVLQMDVRPTGSYMLYSETTRNNNFTLAWKSWY